MEDKQSFIFERNNYFTGKLLTADDFRLEQDYFVHKRRFVNRLLYCGGIICGLHVTPGDKKNAVTVNAGAAIDYQGREIVVDEPVSFELDIKEEQDYVYLCLEYDQEESEDTLAAWDLKEGEKPFNKIKEKYRLFWQEKEHEKESDEIMRKDEINGDNLFWERKIIYENEDFMITQCLPKYVQSNRFFEIRVEVVKFQKLAGKISFSYQIESKYLIQPGKGADKNITISFMEEAHMQSQEYNLQFPAIASDMTGATDIIKISNLEVKLKVKPGENETIVADKSPAFSWEIRKTETDIKKYVHDLYLEKDMEGLLNEFKSLKLYLAKVFYCVQNGSCFISSIDNVPFGQYLDSWRLNKIIQGILPSQFTQGETITEEIIIKYFKQYESEIEQYKSEIEKCKSEFEKYKREFEEYKKSSQETVEKFKKMFDLQPKLASGVETIAINYPKITCEKARDKIVEKIKKIDQEGGTLAAKQQRYDLTELLSKCNRQRPGDFVVMPEVLSLFPDNALFTSGNISHNLGTGYVHITCSIVENNKIFSNSSESSVKAAVSTVLDMEKGSFQITVRLLERTAERKIQVAWSAYKNMAK